MSDGTFRIQQTKLAADMADLRAADFRVASRPRPYTVSFPRGDPPFAWLGEATITLLHHAEALADAPGKRSVTYRMPVLEDGRPTWREFHDIDTGDGAYDYASVVAGDAFEAIALDALAAGIGVRGTVGAGVSTLFPAEELTRFAVAWIEERFRD